MQVCNRSVFEYNGEPSYIIVIMILGSIFGLYLIIRMCRLCFSAFSYANFHIHETYKFYAMALIALAFTIFFHKNQYDYKLFIENQDQSSSQQISEMKKGFQLIYVLFGILSNYSTQLLYTFNGLTWLLITYGCDYSANDLGVQSKISAEQYATTSKLKKKMQVTKKVLLYIIFPVLMMFSTIGVLKEEEGWCQLTSGTLVASSFITVATFVAGAGSFLLKRRKDPTVSMKSKISIGYLIISIGFRQIYLIISVLVGNPMFDQQFIVILFTILCILMPLLVMSLLSQRQLENQKCALLKSSEIYLFKSIVV